MVLLFVLLLFFLIAICFYLALSQGTELPSSVILASFQTKKQQTGTDLIRLFTDKGLIGNRLSDLLAWKLVKRQDSQLMLTGTGKLLWRIMEAYRRVFARPVTE